MPPWLRSTVLVIVSLVLATALTLPLRNITVHSLSLLFVAAVVITSRFGGFVPGIVTALASVAIFDWFFDTRPYHFDFNFAALVRAVVFLSVSLLVASLESRRRLAMQFLHQANRELQAALDEVKTLRGILPICVHCQKIRSEDGSWTRMEEYVQGHSEAAFSHGLCPECYQQHHSEIYRKHHPPK